MLAVVQEAVADKPFLVSALGIGVVSVLVAWRVFFKQETAAQRAARSIPTIPEGFWESAKIFFGSSAPSFVLEKSRTIHKVFTVPLAPPGTPCFVVICDHKIARKVLEDTKSVKYQVSYQVFDQVAGGANFFSAEGLRWRHVRKALTPAFASQKAFYPTILGCLEQWIESTLKPCIQAGEAVNVSEEMQKITIDVMAQLGFDYKWDPNGEEATTVLQGLKIAYLDYFRYSVPTNVARFLMGSLHPGRRRARRAVNNMKKVIQKMLQTHRERKASASSSSSYNQTSIIAFIDENTNYQSDEERICDLVLLLAGGYDTSSYSLSWILLELARHPEEQTKLRRALHDCQSDEEVWNSPVLKQVIRESMRLHPTAALGSLRVAAKDVQVPGDTSSPSFVIPKGAVCVMPFYAIQRDADIYDRPDEFVPSRWENPSEDAMSAFMPYSIGRRNCVGQALAQAELQVITAELIRRFEFTVEAEGYTDYYVTLKNVDCLLRAKPVAGMTIRSGH